MKAAAKNLQESSRMELLRGRERVEELVRRLDEERHVFDQARMVEMKQLEHQRQQIEVEKHELMNAVEALAQRREEGEKHVEQLEKQV